MKLHLEHQNINQAAIDSIARRTSRVEGRHRHNEVKEAVLLIIISDICDDICNNICSDCGEVCGEVYGEVCGEVCDEV